MILNYFKHRKERRLLEKLKYFDKSWYLTQYPDVKKSNMDPFFHYIKFGVNEGRNPSNKFDTTWYLKAYPDVATAGVNPLLHFIRYGRDEERLPKPSETDIERKELLYKVRELEDEIARKQQEYEINLQSQVALTQDYYNELTRVEIQFELIESKLTGFTHEKKQLKNEIEKFRNLYKSLELRYQRAEKIKNDLELDLEKMKDEISKKDNQLRELEFMYKNQLKEKAQELSSLSSNKREMEKDIQRFMDILKSI